MDFFTMFYSAETPKDFFESKSCGFTANEIAHQPVMWRTLSRYLQEVKPQLDEFMKGLNDIKNLRIILTGAGSSGFVGRAVAGFAAKINGRTYEAIHNTDIISAPEVYLPSRLAETPTLLISFARSGNSPESEGAVHYARKRVKNLYELAIVCDGESRLGKTTRTSDKSLLLVMPEGTNDKGFAMTSSVTTMLLAGVAALCHHQYDAIIKDISLLADTVEKSGSAMAKTAEACAAAGFERAWYLGSGAFTALVQEGALKMMELTNGAVVAGSNNAPEFRHGPKTVMNPKTLTVHFIAGDAFTAQYDTDLFNEMYNQRDGNRLIALHDANKPMQADWLVPYQTDAYTAITEAAVGIQGLVFMQLLSMYTSLALKVPTDNPSPTGLVNRVVQGVTVYGGPSCL